MDVCKGVMLNKRWSMFRVNTNYSLMNDKVYKSLINLKCLSFNIDMVMNTAINFNNY